MADGVFFAFDLHAFLRHVQFLELGVQRLHECIGGVVQNNPVLRAFGSGNRRTDGRDVQFQRVCEDRVVIRAPQALRLGVLFNQGDLIGFAAGGLEIVQRLSVNREETTCRAIFRRHVGDGGFVFQRQIGEAGAEEFDEFTDNTLLAQHVHNRQHKVGSGDAFAQLAGQFEADDFRDQHGYRLAQHGGFGLDAANTPAQNGQAVDHGCVAVGADTGVGEGDGVAVFVLGPNRARQIFQVHLVADTGAGGDNTEVFKRRLAPFQELIALLVAFIFAFNVLLESIFIAEIVHHYRVVDDQINGHQRVDGVGVGAKRLGGVAHGGQVDHCWNAGEVLHQNARWAVSNLVLGRALVVQPVCKCLNVLLSDGRAVFVAQQVLEQNLQRGGQTRNVAKAILRGSFQAVVDKRLSVDGKFAAGFEAI